MSWKQGRAGLLVAGMLVSGLGLGPVHSAAAAGLAQPSPSGLCQLDRPCTNAQVGPDNITLTIRYSEHNDIEPDYYQVRWSRPGREETQHHVAGGNESTWRLDPVHYNTTYTFRVQACDSGLFGSDCTPWEEFQVTTGSAPASDTCRTGFVWREATPSDHVCVTPETRTQTAQDNQQAAARRQAGGGDYGADTCRQGYVWREAVAGDHVCVTPATRTAVAQDNSQAASRRVS
jgi:hypothetical protein